MRADLPAISPQPGPRPAVFLDRDGTVTEDRGYARTAAEIALLPGAGHAIRRLNAAGVAAIVVTNQSGVGRGYFTLAELALQHAELLRQLALAGAALDGIYFCPHRPEDACACRKPGRALLDEAATDLGLDLARSWMVGDRADDLSLADHGLRGALLVLTGQGAATAESVRSGLGAERIVPDLERAVDYVLGQLARAGRD